jgi:hypothetical protein
MSPELAAIIGITLYKLGCLTIGALFSVLGYRLFQSGIWGNAGDFDVKFKDYKIVLKSAAPGTFFAVLGAAIIIVTLYQGISFEIKPATSSSTQQDKPKLPENPLKH